MSNEENKKTVKKPVKKKTTTTKTTTKKTTAKKVEPKKPVTKKVEVEDIKKNELIQQRKNITNILFILASVVILGIIMYLSNQSIEKEFNTDYTYNFSELKFEKGKYRQIYKQGNDYFFLTQDDYKSYLYTKNLKIFDNDGYDTVDGLFEVSGKTYFIVIKNNKYGLIDSKGKVIIDFKYSNIYYPGDVKGVDYFILTGDDKYEVALLKNNKIVKNNSYNIYVYSNFAANINQDCKIGYCPVIINKKLRYVDYNGKLVKGTKYNEDMVNNHQLVNGTEDTLDNLIFNVDKKPYFTFAHDNKLGVSDIKGNIIIEPKYYEIRYSTLYKAFVALSEDEAVIINKKGKVIKNISKDLEYSKSEKRLGKYISFEDGIDPEYGMRIYDNNKKKAYFFDNNMNLLKSNDKVLYYGKNFYIEDDKKDQSLFHLYDHSGKEILKNVTTLYKEIDKDNSYHIICVKDKGCTVYNNDLKPLLDNWYLSIDAIKNNNIYLNNDNEYLIYNIKTKKMTTIKKGEIGKIGFALNTIDDTTRVLLIFDHNDTTKYNSDIPKSIIAFNEDGTIKKEYDGSIGASYLINNDTMFTTSGIYTEDGKKKDIDVNKEKFNWARLDDINGHMYYQIFDIAEDGYNYEAKVYRITKDTK